MSITATLVKSTPHVLLFLLDQDGAPESSQTLVLSNADLIAGLSAGPLNEMEGLGADIVGPNSVAVCRKFTLGDGADVHLNHAQCSIQTRSKASSDASWAVDAEFDAVAAQRAALRITSSADASTAYLRIEFEHSITR